MYNELNVTKLRPQSLGKTLGILALRLPGYVGRQRIFNCGHRACIRINTALHVGLFSVLPVFVAISLADRTDTQHDRLLSSSCCPSVRLSVCLSVTLCIVAFRVGVRG